MMDGGVQNLFYIDNYDKSEVVQSYLLGLGLATRLNSNLNCVPSDKIFTSQDYFSMFHSYALYRWEWDKPPAILTLSSAFRIFFSL